MFDQYLNFISLEDDMFVLKPVEKAATVSYYALNRTDVKDAEMEELMESVVDSLFSFFVTMGAVPVIRCPKGVCVCECARVLARVPACVRACVRL